MTLVKALSEGGDSPPSRPTSAQASARMGRPCHGDHPFSSSDPCVPCQESLTGEPCSTAMFESTIAHRRKRDGLRAESCSTTMFEFDNPHRRKRIVQRDWSTRGYSGAPRVAAATVRK